MANHGGRRGVESPYEHWVKRALCSVRSLFIDKPPTEVVFMNERICTDGGHHGRLHPDLRRIGARSGEVIQAKRGRASFVGELEVPSTFISCCPLCWRMDAPWQRCRQFNPTLLAGETHEAHGNRHTLRTARAVQVQLLGGVRWGDGIGRKTTGIGPIGDYLLDHLDSFFIEKYPRTLSSPVGPRPIVLGGLPRQLEAGMSRIDDWPHSLPPFVEL